MPPCTAPAHGVQGAVPVVSAQPPDDLGPSELRSIPSLGQVVEVVAETVPRATETMRTKLCTGARLAASPVMATLPGRTSPTPGRASANAMAARGEREPGLARSRNHAGSWPEPWSAPQR